MNTKQHTIQSLDCSTRMFVASLCLTDLDLEQLGLWSRRTAPLVSAGTAARAVLHRLIVSHDGVAQAVTDLLDLRHFEILSHVRSSNSNGLSLETGQLGQAACGADLAGWAWAILTDMRPEMQAVAKTFMSECYVRGLQALGHGSFDVPTPTDARPGRDA